MLRNLHNAIPRCHSRHTGQKGSRWNVGKHFQALNGKLCTACTNLNIFMVPNCILFKKVQKQTSLGNRSHTFTSRYCIWFACQASDFLTFFFFLISTSKTGLTLAIGYWSWFAHFRDTKIRFGASQHIWQTCHVREGIPEHIMFFLGRYTINFTLHHCI